MGSSFMATRKKKTLAVILLLAVLTPVAARYYAWKSASNFGRYYAEGFKWVAKSEFADTKGLQAFLDEHPLGTLYFRTQRLRFLGGGYSARIDEFKTAMIYLTEEASLPIDQRTTAPPDLKYFTVQTESRSDDALWEAAAMLIEDYNRKLSFF